MGSVSMDTSKLASSPFLKFDGENRWAQLGQDVRVALQDIFTEASVAVLPTQRASSGKAVAGAPNFEDFDERLIC